MAMVKQLLEAKGTGTNYTVDSEATVLDALAIMAEANTGAVMVTEAGKIIGIFTERDYARKGELQGHAAQSTAVRELMTAQMVTAKPDTTIDQCMELMKRYHIRHLPVVDQDTMVGMVSMRDVVDILLEDRESTIKGLENYIFATGFAT